MGQKRMGICSIIFAISFLWLLPLIYSAPYVTARAWADMVAMIAAIFGIYDLLYLFFLRKKDNVTFKRVLARMFLYFFIVQVLYIFIYYVELFFDGYTRRDFVGNRIGYTVYGFEAIKSDVWGNLILIPLLTISGVYMAIYAIIDIKGRRRHGE